jgi:flagellar basal body-associated protein FliL
VLIGISAGAAVLLAACLIGAILLAKRKKRAEKEPKRDTIPLEEITAKDDSILSNITAEDIVLKQKLGAGAFGEVFDRTICVCA